MKLIKTISADTGMLGFVWHAARSAVVMRAEGEDFDAYLNKMADKVGCLVMHVLCSHYHEGSSTMGVMNPLGCGFAVSSCPSEIELSLGPCNDDIISTLVATMLDMSLLLPGTLLMSPE
jgi:hypothetical protein